MGGAVRRGRPASAKRALCAHPSRGIVRQMFAFEHGADSLLSPLLGAALCMFLLRLSALLCASATRSRDLRAIARVKQEVGPNRPSPHEDKADARST